MATELTMPQMGYDMQEGTIVRWLKDEGASVQMGEAIAEIETDKAIVEFESYADGTLRMILVGEGATVPVGQAIAVVAEAEEDLSGFAAMATPDVDAESDLSSDEAAEPVEAAVHEPVVQAPTPAPEPVPSAPAGPSRASPLARRLAEDRGIDIDEVPGTGPGGRVVKDDVIAFAAAVGGQAPADEEAEAEEPAAVAEVADAEAVAEVEEPEVEVEAVEEEAHEEMEEPAAEVEVVEEEPEEVMDEPAAEVEAVEEEVAEIEEPVAEVEEAEEDSEDIEEPVVELEAVEESETEAALPEPDLEPFVIEEVQSATVAIREELQDAESFIPEPDLEPAMQAEAPVVTEEAAGQSEVVPLSRMRQQIARVTVRSKQEQPHFYITSDIDMTEAMSLRRQINESLESQGVRISVNDLIVTACVGAIKRYPKFNSFYTDEGIQMNDRINIGIAIAEESGLIVPAILDCGDKALRDVSEAAKDLITRSQSGTLRSEEYTGSTFSTSNLGMFDVTSFTAIIHPPQTGVLAAGSVEKRAVVQGDEIVVREMMTATLSADHRVVDGAEGAQFMMEVKSLLETPLSLLV